MKVDLADKNGAIGVILYSDPIDYAQQGREFIYPDSWWMPGMAVQSGTVYLNKGDPLTPFYPSIGIKYTQNTETRFTNKMNFTCI